MTTPRDLLILKHQDFRTEVSGFFKELNKDSALRNLFFTNPSLVLRTKLPSLSDINISEQQDELANKVLFSALSNEKFMTFLQEYQERKNEAIERFLKSPEDKRAAAELDERTMRAEVAEALLEFGDKELFANILRGGGSATQRAGAPVLVSIVVLVVNIAVIAGIHLIIHTVVKLGMAGFEENPPISAAAMRKIANQLVAAARQAREAGDLME
jgi:uncharacterized protein YneF (UPF0154 family)